jgi:ATP-binding cassette subfamily B protein
LKFAAGEKIAVVGKNGAGKTTLIKLLCGLYSPSSGKILINGTNTAAVSKSSCFDLFATIFQDYYFLPMTIQQNITAGTEYDRKRLFDAFEKAGIADKINSLPDREHSLMCKEVYKNAVDFSGGEKQKLLLAKAIYKNAPILILDEPTAALDPIAENELYLKYNELTRGKLSFFISHRLSSTRFCDRILFVSNGEIIEEGSHAELMAKKGAYYRMYQVQSYYYKEREAAGE